MSRRELAIALILFMGLMAPLIPFSECALIPQDQTISIVDTQDDKWSTEIGRGIDSYLVHVLDPEYDVYSWVIFRGVEINFWEPLEPGNATLRLHTSNTMTNDTDSSITIYGMKVDELQSVLPIGSSFAISVPKTDNYVVLNTSAFHTPQWHDIDVTAIVEELIRAHNWDGDGLTGADTGDAIGFIMLGARGHDVRYFDDYRSDPALSAQLVIHWNHQPPLNDPPDNYEFIEQYRNYSIWTETTIFDCNMSVIGGDEDNSAEFYHTTYPRGTTNNTDYDRVNVNSDPTPGMGYADTVAQIGKNIIVLLDQGQIRLYYSRDAGSTWSSLDLNDQFTDLAVHTSYTEGSMSVDINGTIHIIWGTKTPASPGAIVQVYSNFTIDESGAFNFYDGYHEWGFEMFYENIEVDRYGRVHIAFAKDDQNTYYTTRFLNGTWLSPETIYTTDGTRYHNVDVADMPSTPYVAITYQRLGATNAILQTIRAPNGTLTTTFMAGTTCHFPSSAMDMDGNMSWSAWEFITTIQGWYHIITRGFNFTTLSRPSEQIVSAIEQNHQRVDVGIGDNRKAYFMWYRLQGFNDYRGRRMFLNGSFDGPSEIIMNLGAITGSGSIVPKGGISYNITSYFITDLNGTIVVDDLDSLEDSQDWIDEEQGYDPTDPDPPGWVTEGPFTRFKMRLYFLLIGYFAVWGPIWFMCWRRPSGFYVGVAFIIMLMGVGMLLNVPNV